MRSNGKREKWVEEFYFKYTTATYRAKRKLREIIIVREHNTQKGGDQKQQERGEIPSKRKGNPIEVEKKGIPRKSWET